LSGAAAIVIVASVSWIFMHNNSAPAKKNSTAQIQTLVAEKGSRTRTILPDGSSVWLNADSHISYAENFSSNTREVKLDGEAYFDVVKDAKRPFIVHVADYDIRVLGTVFNVKSYPDDKTIETTLIRGLVQVTKHNLRKQKPIYLHPNEKLIVEKFAANKDAQLPIQSNNAEKDYTIKPLDSSLKEPERIETAWVYNRLEFNGDNFEELAGKLERWYNVTILFDDDAVKNLHLHGSFENETIEQALAALKIATPFNYEIHGKEIHIKSAG
jgi:ferric-dicitrate binding protein FerR (iron transport regulator)